MVYFFEQMSRSSAQPPDEDAKSPGEVSHESEEEFEEQAAGEPQAEEEVPQYECAQENVDDSQNPMTPTPAKPSTPVRLFQAD
jgi:hypothetical protein